MTAKEAKAFYTVRLGISWIRAEPHTESSHLLTARYFHACTAHAEVYVHRSGPSATYKPNMAERSLQEGSKHTQSKSQLVEAVGM